MSNCCLSYEALAFTNKVWLIYLLMETLNVTTELPEYLFASPPKVQNRIVVAI
jgi:hypothetical protein